MDLAHTYLGEKALEQGLKYILKQPIDNISKLLEWAEKIPMADHHKRDFESVRKFLENKETNWYKLAEKLLTETDPNVKEKFGINFF